MALKELCAQLAFERVYMADNGRMVNAKHFSRSRHCTQSRHLIGRPKFVPVVDIQAARLPLYQYALSHHNLRMTQIHKEEIPVSLVPGPASAIS